MAGKRIALSGVGGYAIQYLMALLEPREGTQPFEFVAAADPFAENSRYYPKLVDHGIKVYADFKDLIANETVDLCIISSPIQFHLEQTRLAMEHGAHVLCEKPIAATLQQAYEMRDLETKYGRRIMIGFQWSYAKGMLELKRDIMAGRYGRPVDLRVMVDWPRGSVYYARPWAAKIYDEEGRPVFDSIANNACAHYIHNMLFMLGDEMDVSAEPEQIDVQLYRAHDIQNFDTAFIKMKAAGADLMFAASHSGRENRDPIIDYRFEKARITTTGGSDTDFTLIVKTDDGQTIEYPMGASHQEKFYWALNWLDGEKMPCTVETAIPHMKCINALSNAPINDIDEKYITKEELAPGNMFNVAHGMDRLLDRALETGELPHVGDEPYIAESVRV